MEETLHAREVEQLEQLVVLEKLGPTQRLHFAVEMGQYLQEHHLRIQRQSTLSGWKS